jgi:hypothetical protein
VGAPRTSRKEPVREEEHVTNDIQQLNHQIAVLHFGTVLGGSFLLAVVLAFIGHLMWERISSTLLGRIVGGYIAVPAAGAMVVLAICIWAVAQT